jgi:hypothetical protein
VHTGADHCCINRVFISTENNGHDEADGSRSLGLAAGGGK